MNKIRTLTALFFLLLLAVAMQAQQVDISGFGRTYEGLKTQNGDFIIIQQTLNLNFEKRGEKVAFKANPMSYFYGTDSLALTMRELYMDMYFKNFDLRLGKQQVVWGKADGVFITDIVSPLNLSEFLLPDFDEIRIGVIAAKMDYYLGNGTIEAIVIPQFAPNQRPGAGSPWYIQPDFPAMPLFDMSRSSISPSLENSEAFVKYSHLSSKFDFDLMAGYTHDDNPAMHVQKIFSFDSSSTPPHPVLSQLLITPEYHRLTVAGGSFSTEIKGVVLRGEAAYYDGKYFQTKDPDANDALVQKNYLHYLAGVDFNIGELKLSSQFIQQYIFDYDEAMEQEQSLNTATVMVRYDMFRETLHLELFSYIGINKGDALIRPKISYDFDDGYSVLLGANLFVGDEEGFFGRYHDNSMLYTKIKYSF